MKVIIEGTIEQVKAACYILGEPPPLPLDLVELEAERAARALRRQKKREMQDRLEANRRILHRAYLIVRKQPDQESVMKKLVSALAGRAPMTGELFLTAETIISAQGAKEEGHEA